MYPVFEKFTLLQQSETTTSGTTLINQKHGSPKKAKYKKVKFKVLSPVALDGFREVSKDEFYNIVGPLDVTLSTLGNYPYTTEFKLRHGRLVGKTVDSYAGEHSWPVVTRYYISCSEIGG